MIQPFSIIALPSLRSRRALGAVLTLAMIGCLPSVPASPPRVRACLAPGGSPDSAPSRGVLRVLPSGLPGVTIESADWHTSASTEDLGANEFLNFSSTLRSERPVERRELAVVYEIDGQRPLVSAEFWLPPDSEGRIPRVLDTTIVLPPWVATTFTRSLRVQSGFRIGKNSAVAFCPRGTARVIRRNDIALYLMPRLAADDGPATRRPNDVASMTPLVVLGDTSIDVEIDHLIVGAVLNTADTTVHDVVVAAIVDILVAGQRDTIEYRMPDVPPHARVGFSGTSLVPPEQIIGWTSYPASTVSRPIAGAADRYRASWVRRRLTPRAKPPWPMVDADDDVGRRSCMIGAAAPPSDPWKRVSGAGFDICLPIAWTDSAGTLRGPGGAITPQRVPLSSPNDPQPPREAGLLIRTVSSTGGPTVRILSKDGAFVTRSVWAGAEIRMSGVAADSAAAALELQIYQTVRFHKSSR